MLDVRKITMEQILALCRPPTVIVSSPVVCVCKRCMDTGWDYIDADGEGDVDPVVCPECKGNEGADNA